MTCVISISSAALVTFKFPKEKYVIDLSTPAFLGKKFSSFSECQIYSLPGILEFLIVCNYQRFHFQLHDDDSHDSDDSKVDSVDGIIQNCDNCDSYDNYDSTTSKSMKYKFRELPPFLPNKKLIISALFKNG